ncbi:MAG: hypothetical protein ACI9ES_002502, partial [Oceanospirillaceae bacterium]
ELTRNARKQLSNGLSTLDVVLLHKMLLHRGSGEVN